MKLIELADVYNTWCARAVGTEELERIRQKLHVKLHSLVNDHDARRQYQASYDRVVELATWKLKDRSPSQSPTNDTNVNEIAETMVLVGTHQNSSLFR